MSEFKLIISPDNEEPEAAEIYVDGNIEDHLYRFLLDTGSARTLVVFDDYTSTFSCIEQSSSSGMFAKTTDDVILVPNIKVGTLSKQDFKLARMAAEATGQRNLIGMDFLKDFSCHFCFDENRVLVDTNNILESGLNFEELFLDKGFHAYIDVQFGEVKAKAVWDTGASLTVVDTNFINKHPDSFQKAGQSAGTDSSGAQMETPMFIMSAVTMGNKLFPPHRVAGVDFSYVNSTIEVPMDLILGYNTLSKANWLFDFTHKKWAISKWLSA